MPLAIGDFLADTAHLDTEAKGAVVLILMAMWRSEAKVPNDDRALAAITGLGTRRWRARRAQILALFQVSDSWVFHAGLQEDYEHAWKVYRSRVENGREGGRPATKDLFDGTERLTERIPERGGVGGGQGQGHIHASANAEAAGAQWSKEQQLAAVLQHAGIPMDAGDVRLATAVAVGVRPEHLQAVIREHPGKGAAYVVKTATGRAQDAAGSPPPPPRESPATVEIRKLEDRIIEARHFKSIGHISPEECEQRVISAKTQIRALTGQVSTNTEGA